jgi:hypothetical protein
MRRNANETSATSFRVERGAAAAAAGLARIIVEAPEQLEHIRRERFVGGRVILPNRFPDLGQHHVPKVGRWPIAALGFHDSLIQLVFEALPPILSAGAIRRLTGRFWYLFQT